MIAIPFFADAKVAVFGLGMSGRAAAQALSAGGAQVFAWDDGESGRAQAAREGIALHDLREANWSQFAALILAPGVPLTHPEPHWTVRKAQEAGVEIIGDTELFFRAYQRARHAGRTGRTGRAGKVIAITGTNGKSTTTALIAHIIESSGRKVSMGGNIGHAVLELAPFEEDLIYVIEFSSYQIDLTPSLAPDIAILLNITPDHLDRHGSLAHYAEVKERIVAALPSNGTAICAVDDALSADIYQRLKQRGDAPFALYPISARQKPGEAGQSAYGRGEDVVLYVEGEEQVYSLENNMALRGAHNRQNAAAAIVASAASGLSRHEIAAGLASFPGLAHRSEPLGQIAGVTYINDSKATNVEAASKALASFRNIYWICGGQAKSEGIAGLEAFYPHIVKAYLIGEAAEPFADYLAGDVPAQICGTIENAVRTASADAQRALAEGSLPESSTAPVILLSPACASFDQFANFALRGDAFRQAVEELR